MAKKQKRNGYGALARLFYDKWRLGLLLAVFLIGSGATIYTSIIKREGFPPVQFPITFVNGVYFANDTAKVDTELAKPFYEAVKDIEGVDRVSTTATDNGFNGVVFFEESVDPVVGSEAVSGAVKSLPKEAIINVLSIDPSAFLNKYDLLLTVYADSTSADLAKLQEVANYVATELEAEDAIVLAETQPLLTESTDVQTGASAIRQTAFNSVGIPNAEGEVTFARAVTVGVDRDKDSYDIIELSEIVNEKIAQLDFAQFGEGYRAIIGADFAEGIEAQISSLESNLFSGLLAVAIVSLLLITWRASLITALFMVIVMAVTVAVLYIVGYTLNTITLFGLVLALGLFVDDATIVVESIDANKRQKKSKRDIIYEAVGKVGAASFSGTFTTIFAFAPLAFVSGVLGEFIRLLPITVIISLVTSLVVSLTLIPVIARFVMLRNTNMSWFTRVNPVGKAESWLANKLSAVVLLLKTRPALGKSVALGLLVLPILSVVGSGYFAQKITFNIFPPSKDSDQLGIILEFPAGYTIEQAEQKSQTVNAVIAETLPGLVQKVSYGSFSAVQPNSRSADVFIELTPFTERDKKSPEIITDLERELTSVTQDGTKARVVQYDAGPPVDEFPFKVQIYGENTEASFALAKDLATELSGLTLERPNGTTAQISEVSAPSPQIVTRQDGKQYIEVAASFTAEDTSALLVAAEEETKELFPADRIRSYGLADDALTFDFGQESENADSFAALGLVFPIAIGAMFVLLAIQFRSFLQPLLIFLAIPFSMFGVFAGLYATDNALSFFVMVGLIGLIGIAVNNTILLTEYANQERQAGLRTIEAMSNAVKKRFRPLVTTTTTTIVALLPLALADPFWEPLAFTIIFGLASSTFFVIVSFPYYYIAAEWLRNRTKLLIRRIRRAA